MTQADPQTETGYVVAVVSGGLDSTTMVYDLVSQGRKVDLVGFNYGQRHNRELTYMAATGRTLGLRYDIVDLSDSSHLFRGTSAIATTVSKHDNGFRAPEVVAELEADDPTVPEGHYAEETMKATVVPNRNMIMLSFAAGIAVARGADQIATAVHSGDHFIYPDCRPEFIAYANAAILLGNAGFGSIPGDIDSSYFGVMFPNFIHTPYLNKSKADIAYRALELNVPLHMTWSCYKGGSNHCGRCGTCVERLEAIDEAIRRTIANDEPDTWNEDMTTYDDAEFWKAAVRQAKEAKNV
jgi:7-cyano-7-deazaguanine synthase